MNILTCPACSKPCHPKATQCRWCGADVHKGGLKADEAVGPSIQKEIEELQSWNPPPAKAPPLFSPLTWILAILVLAALAVDLSNPSMPLRSMGARILNFVLVPLLAWSATLRDWSVRKSRHRETPGDALEYYVNRIARRLYGQSRRALADHPSSTLRHANLKEQIRQGGDLEVHQVRILKVESLGKDWAVVEAEVQMRTVSYVVLPLPGLLYGQRSTSGSARVLSKLLVRRNGRWFLANGLLADRIDRKLSRCILDKADSGPAE